MTAGQWGGGGCAQRLILVRGSHHRARWPNHEAARFIWWGRPHRRLCVGWGPGAPLYLPLRAAADLQLLYK